MPNYLCIQKSQPEQAKGEKPSPAQMEEMFTQFNAWKEKFKNNIIDLGGKLKPGKMVTVEGTMDGPMVESKEIIGGYMILSADSVDEAIEIATGVPGLVRPGSGVEVREISTP